MKKFIVMAITVAAFAACNKNEPAPPIEGQEQKLDILTSVSTRAVVQGTEMPQGSAIGVHVTQGTGIDLKAYIGKNYVANGENLENGQNVRFDNNADAAKWVSQTDDATPKVANLMIGFETGTVYAYYPYAADVTGTGEDATIPATVLQSGDIDLSTAEAGKKYYDADEVDYLYYKPDANGRKEVSSASTATAPLSMAHAMASVSFRMYVSSEAPVITPDPNETGDDNKYYLMSYTIKNKDQKTLFRADNTDVTMNIVDGTLIIPNTGGEIKRTLNGNDGYALTRVNAKEATPEEKNALVWFGHLTFPIANIEHETANGIEISKDIEIVFSIKKGKLGQAKNYVVPLVVTTGNADDALDSDKWLAGKNYQYTIKLNAFLALGIQEVTVTDWQEIVGGDITID